MLRTLPPVNLGVRLPHNANRLYSLSKKECMANFKHHSEFPKAKQLQAFRFPYVCFTCRKSYKYPAQSAPRICPQCAKPMEMLSRKFSAPKSKDKQQWLKVQYLVEHGFRFYAAYEMHGAAAVRMKYPSTLEDAKTFVLKVRQKEVRAA